MEVRPVLVTALIVAAALGISAFLFPGLSALGGPPDVTTSDTPGFTPAVPDPYEVTEAEPTVVIRIGQNGSGFPIRVWNDSPMTRTVSLDLVHNESDTSLVTRTETLPPNGTVRLELGASGGYLLEVVDDSTGATGTYPVRTDQFDCNERFATVRIDGNGSLDSRTVATAMEC